MTFRRLGVIIAFMLFFALLYCYLMVSVFTKKCYTQHDLLIYQLLTPKLIKQVPRVSSDWFFVSHTDEGSHLQRSEIVFTGIPKNDIHRAEEKLNAYVESYPASREMMSVVVEARAGNYDVKVIHYKSDE